MDACAFALQQWLLASKPNRSFLERALLAASVLSLFGLTTRHRVGLFPRPSGSLIRLLPNDRGSALFSRSTRLPVRRSWTGLFAFAPDKLLDGVKLCRHHCAYLRAVAQGIPAADAARR